MKKRYIIFLYLFLVISVSVSAYPKNIIGELFTETCTSCGGDISSARSALIQLAERNSNFIPVIWQTSEPQSPGVYDRSQTFNVTALPQAWFNGTLEHQGEGFAYDTYQLMFNQLSGYQSPISIELDLEVNNDTLLTRAHIQLDSDIASGNTIHFLITKHDLSNYSSLVIQNSGPQDFTLSQQGETAEVTYSFQYDSDIDIDEYRAVVFIQNTGTGEIIQSRQTIVTDLRADFSVDNQVGPASFRAYFNNLSQPSDRITQWMWDFQNDGIIDSYEESPDFLFENPEVYDVALYVSDGTDTASIVKQRAVYVTDGSNVNGRVTGLWKREFSPYIVRMDVLVPEGGLLEIDPGVQIIFNTGKKLSVFGTIEVNGQEQDPVIMTSETSWKGLKLVSSDNDNIIKNAIISKATLSGIYLTASNAFISGVVVHNNNTGLLAGGIEIYNSDSVRVSNSIIANNTSEDNSGGIGIRSSNVEIMNSVIVNNTGLTNGSISVLGDSLFKAVNNTIVNNFSHDGVSIIIDSDNAVLKNNIIRSEFSMMLTGINTEISYSNISGFTGGLNNIDSDPLFMNTSEGIGSDYNGLSASWYLAAGSPSIDSGDPDPEYNDVGDPLNDGFALYPAMGTLRNDMGAYGGMGNTLIYTKIDDKNEVNEAPHSKISNYPNPFNPKTIIQVSLSKKDVNHIMDVTIYNLKGQKVANLFNDIPKQEQYNIEWNGRNDTGLNVASGIYFAKLTTKSQTSLKKLVLIK